MVRRWGLATVCDEAGCPNRPECFREARVSFLLMGPVCSRACGFCGVPTGIRLSEPDGDEPLRLAGAVRSLGSAYVVLTSVTRDDLPDGGAAHLAECVRRVKDTGAGVELLCPDFGGRKGSWARIWEAGCDVVAHNIETVRRLSPALRSGGSYERSLAVLRMCAEAGRMPVKSGFMVGLGETREEVRELLADLAAAGVSIVTVGQYQTPRRGKVPVVRHWRDEEFLEVAEEARRQGIPKVLAGRFVRSSYGAEALAGRN